MNTRVALNTRHDASMRDETRKNFENLFRWYARDILRAYACSTRRISLSHRTILLITRAASKFCGVATNAARATRAAWRVDGCALGIVHLIVTNEYSLTAA
jgi:hypothetical protein